MQKVFCPVATVARRPAQTARGWLALLVLIGATATGSAIGFQGNFAPGNWQLYDFNDGTLRGTSQWLDVNGNPWVDGVNTAEQLVLTGPFLPGLSSIGMTLMNNPNPSSGTLSFRWTLYTGTGASATGHFFPGEGSPSQIDLPGSASVQNIAISANTLIGFELESRYIPGKPWDSLTIDQFDFHPAVPETAATGLLLLGGWACCFGFRRLRRAAE